MAALGLTEEQYLALLQSLKNTPAPDGFLLLHPDFDEATEQDYYNTYLAELFQGVIPPGFEVIAEWEGLWLQAFAANPTNPFDFSDGPRSPSQTLTVDYDAYFTPSPEQLVQKNLAEAIAALQGLDPEDFALPPSQRVLIAKVKLALAKFEHGLGRVSRILLERTVVRRMDGCTLRGEPDTRAGFDTVVNCPAQERVYPHVVAAVELLGELQ